MEASLALAGFAGVVTILAKRGAGELAPLQRLNLVNLLATAFGALFMSLVALVMLAAGAGDPLVWRVISGAGFVVTVYFGSRSVRRILAIPAPERLGRGVSTLLAINGPLALVCVAQLWNLVQAGEFWPVLLLLVALFGIGCYSFVRLLFAPAI